MRTLSFLALSTLVLTAFAQNTTTFDPTQDNYQFKTIITNSTQNGFTIEYKNYYKVVTNLLTNQQYCLVGWKQPLPAGCDNATSFNTPITEFSIDSDSYTVVPFIELLGLQSKLSSNLPTQNITSPCLTDNSRSTAPIDPQLTFSFQTHGAKYASFSGSDDRLGPLNRAAWLLYIGAFFDLELQAFQTLNYISNNYNCHKQNLGAMATPKVVSWTTYDAIQNTYTVHRDEYYAQLASDAGAMLRAPNQLQESMYMANSSVNLHAMAMIIQGAEYIIDNSQPSVTYNTWYQQGGIYFTPNNSFAHVNAIANGKVFSNNGLVNGNGVSDWVQRSPARPDLALLDLIKLLYPSFGIAGNTVIPIWLTSFSDLDRRVISEVYGNCSDIAQSAYTQSACTIGGNGSNSYRQIDLSTGGKAGISVGAVLFMIAATIAGIYLYRRYRRKQRHNFYRMHDFQ